MNVVTRIESAYDEIEMLAYLDQHIAAVRAGKSEGGMKAAWIQRCKTEPGLMVEVCKWAWKMREAHLNAENGGLSMHASNGQTVLAPSSAPSSNGAGQSRVAAQSGRGACASSLLSGSEDDGHKEHAAECGHKVGAVSSPTHGDGAGQMRCVSDDRVANARPSPTVPYREPSAADIRARLGAKLRAADVVLTVLDTYKIDGTPIGNMTMLELRETYERNVEHNAVIKQVLRSTANAPANMKVREALKASDLDAMIKKAKDLADVA